MLNIFKVGWATTTVEIPLKKSLVCFIYSLPIKGLRNKNIF